MRAIYRLMNMLVYYWCDEVLNENIWTRSFFCGRRKAAAGQRFGLARVLFNRSSLGRDDLLVSVNNGIKNAVVSLQNIGPETKRDWNLPPAKMDQKQCSFTPHVVIVPVGGTVEFLNSDRLLHNVRSTGKENPPFNRAQPHARSISFSFKQPELLRIDCDLHSWMRGWVVVAEHPFYAVTDEQGEFSLENVPRGKYTMQVWQESLGTVTQQVVVGDKGVTTVSVGMGKK
jgi:plastocyanin